MADFGANLPDHIELNMLASESVDTLTTDPLWAGRQVRMELQRVSLAPGESYVDQLTRKDPTFFRPPAGLALLYVETGEMTVARQGIEESYRSGEQTAVAAGQSYDIRNSGAECASMLQLSIQSQFPGGMGVAASADVPNVPAPCPESKDLLILLSHGWPTLPARMFLARVTLQPPWGSIGAHVHTGPTGLVVESGQVQVDDVMTIPMASDPRVGRALAHDGWAAIPSGVPYTVILAGTDLGLNGPEPATALVVGVVPADEPWYVPLDYVSPAYGYRLSWDDSWRVTGESWSTDEGQYGSLQIENGITQTQVQFQEFAGYQGHSVQCLDDSVYRRVADPAVTNLRPERQNGQMIEERDVTRAYAEYTYNLTDGNGSTQELVEHIECRTLVPGGAVIVINAFMTIDPRIDLVDQRQALEELLAGLVLP
jgi:mannose-6-phosphate isomerase-like protein (cupin superfamily)